MKEEDESQINGITEIEFRAICALAFSVLLSNLWSLIKTYLCSRIPGSPPHGWQLLKSAARLSRLGLYVDAARETLRQLAARGVPYDSEEMLRAYERFTELDRQWRELEQKHLALREEIQREKAK